MSRCNRKDGMMLRGETSSMVARMPVGDFPNVIFGITGKDISDLK